MLRNQLQTVFRIAAVALLTSAGTAAAETKAGDGAVRWGYAADNGPAQWAALEPRFIECAEGAMQSPIDLTAPGARALATIRFDYRPAPLDVVNNGHTVQVNYAPGSAMIVNGARYELLQFHFHTPSEHTLAGARFPLEVHLVHKNAEDVLAVVGVFLAEATVNQTLATIWRRMPKTAGPAVRYGDVAVNAAELLPSRRQFFRYMGSLTTPPCTEGVNWFVADQAIVVGPRQLQQLKEAIGANARPPQPLNDRLLTAPPLQ